MFPVTWPCDGGCAPFIFRQIQLFAVRAMYDDPNKMIQESQMWGYNLSCRADVI